MTNEVKKVIDYRIVEIDVSKYKLESVVETNFGGKAINWICEGSLEFCERIREQLQKPYNNIHKEY